MRSKIDGAVFQNNFFLVARTREPAQDGSDASQHFRHYEWRRNEIVCARIQRVDCRGSTSPAPNYDSEIGLRPDGAAQPVGRHSADSRLYNQQVARLVADPLKNFSGGCGFHYIMSFELHRSAQLGSLLLVAARHYDAVIQCQSSSLPMNSISSSANVWLKTILPIFASN